MKSCTEEIKEGNKEKYDEQRRESVEKLVDLNTEEEVGVTK